jgi:hypothetical protein
MRPNIRPQQTDEKSAAIWSRINWIVMSDYITRIQLRSTLQPYLLTKPYNRLLAGLGCLIQAFCWARMSAIDCFAHLALCHWLEGCTFRQIVAQQGVAVFIQASLPRTVSVWKIDLRRLCVCLLVTIPLSTRILASPLLIVDWLTPKALAIAHWLTARLMSTAIWHLCP